MREFTAKLRSFSAARDGATAIEYAIIAAGIAAAIVTTITALGGSVSAMWGLVAKTFS
jgi:pilus assembly protein Flp/PilA